MDVRTILVFFLMFTVLVFVHEFGHFLTARATGMRVLEFGFGFPPRLFGIQRPATYLVETGALTLDARGRTLSLRAGDRLTVGRSRETWLLRARGGALGLDAGERFTASGDALFRPSWARAGTATFRIGAAEFRAGSPTPALFPFQPGVEYTINAIPFGGFVRILGEDGSARLPDGSLVPDSFAARPIPARMLVLVAGVAMNVLLGFALFAAVSLSGEPDFTVQAAWQTIEPGSPAEAAGIQPGDVIVAADGRTFDSVTDLTGYIYSRAGNELVLTIRRGEQTVSGLRVYSRTEQERPPTVKCGAASTVQGPIGICDPKPIQTLRSYVRYPLDVAVQRAASRTGEALVEIPRAFGRLFTNLVGGRGPGEEVSGPVGIFTITSQVVPQGAAVVLQLTALLSLNLGVLNIIPFPGLDGGRLLFVVIEALRGGRRLDPRTEAAIHALGFVFLLALVGVVTLIDIRRLPGG